MPSFQYRALTRSGELVSGSISRRPCRSRQRIEYLGLLPVETIMEARDAAHAIQNIAASRPCRGCHGIYPRPGAAAQAGARIDDALDLLAVDIDIGRLRAVVAQIRGRVLAGESLSEALAHHPLLFPPMYLALVRVGEASGTLDHVLDVLGNERNRGEAMRRKVADALRYPAFVLLAAFCVVILSSRRRNSPPCCRTSKLSRMRSSTRCSAVAIARAHPGSKWSLSP